MIEGSDVSSPWWIVRGRKKDHTAWRPKGKGKPVSFREGVLVVDRGGASGVASAFALGEHGLAQRGVKLLHLHGL